VLQQRPEFYTAPAHCSGAHFARAQGDAVLTPWMNYVGVALALVSLALYSQVETTTAPAKEQARAHERQVLGVLLVR